MLRRPGAFALPLGFACALAISACGSNDSQESGAKLTPPPMTSGAGTAATTGTTAATTVQTTTAAAPATTSTAATTTTTSGSASGGATTTQPTTGFTGGARGAPAGCPNAVGGFIRDLHGGDCAVARTVASAWFDAVHGGAAPDGPIEAAGYSCRGTLAGERASVSCDGDGGAVSFTASP